MAELSSLNIFKFGYHPSVATAVVSIWDGLVAYPWPAAAATTTIVSSSTNDAAAGTGIATVQVQGIVKSGAVLTHTVEEVALTGTDAVTLSNDFYRVYRMKGLTNGSGGSRTSLAIGNIQVKHSATVLAQISIGYTQTNMAVYTIPTVFNGDTVVGAELETWHATVGEGKDALTSIWIAPVGGIFNQKNLLPGFEGTVKDDYKGKFSIDAGSDIEVRSISSASGTPVSAGFHIRLRIT